MAARGSPLVFEDVFSVLQRDPDGKKFDKVSRFKCRSEYFEMDMLIDINVGIYKLEVGQKFTMSLAWTLNLDGTPDSADYDQSGKKSVMDKYEYAMHGKLFQYKEDASRQPTQVELVISFGGLILQLKGSAANVQGLEQDQRLYCLIRKV